jgi:calcium-translocating P-type ATPase
MKESSNLVSENKAWHAWSAEEVARRLQADAAQGLTDGTAAERLQEYGPNRLPEGKKRGPLERFLAQLNNVLIYVLLAAGAGKLFLGEVLDASIILGVVLINGLLGFVQEGRAEKALESIRKMLSSEAKTLRGGKLRLLPAEDLVPGDVVQLKSGDKVPADLRLISATNLRIEEAALTGESVPASKQTDAVEEGAPVGDRKGMAYSGTLVVSGQARGIVVETGTGTELGKINQMLGTVQTLETPLLRQIEKFGKALTAVILIVSALAFVYGKVFLNQEFLYMFKAVVGIAVAAIPEGLPAIVTITLAIGVQRMARRNAIIRRLPAVETLGAVSRICSDKTGTLTRNEMVVTEAVTAEGLFVVTGAGYAPEGEVLLDGVAQETNATLREMARVSVLCNEAELYLEEGQWKLVGDPTEGALLPFAAKLGLDRKEELAARPRTAVVPFESEHKYMATLHGEVLMAKGAPDVLLARCSGQQVGGETAPLDVAYWEEANRLIASRGNRVLALAWQRESAVAADSLHVGTMPKDLVLLGLVGIIDPPREEAIQAVAECHHGGIRVTMITGDHALTATSIAAKLGIGDGEHYLTGAEIEGMDDEALERKCRRIDVFARTSPEHKLRLVRAMQADGSVVAMTGDGVNDAPSLRQADVGVAMGIKGTEVSKEAAEMVLADDNFASITAAVREGRTVYANIEKAILFMLPTNGGQGLTILSAILLGLTLPVTPPQILWVNMVVSITLALAIAFEPHEPDVMRRPPRRSDKPLLEGFGLWRIGFISFLLLVFTFGAFYFTKTYLEAPIELCRTMAVNALIMGQAFFLVNSRFLTESSLTLRALAGNRWIPGSLLAIALLQLGFTYLPFMQAIFGTAPLPLVAWGWLLLGGLIFFLIVELEKAVVRAILPEEKCPAGSASPGS